MMRRTWLERGLLVRLLGAGLLAIVAPRSQAVASPFVLSAPKACVDDPKVLALLDAALAGDLSRARQAVADGASPDTEGPKDDPYRLPDDAGATVLMRAIDAQDYDLAISLLRQGASATTRAHDMTVAYSIEFHLKKFVPGSAMYLKVLQLKELAARAAASAVRLAAAPAWLAPSARRHCLRDR